MLERTVESLEPFVRVNLPTYTTFGTSEFAEAVLEDSAVPANLEGLTTVLLGRQMYMASIAGAYGVMHAVERRGGQDIIACIENRKQQDLFLEAKDSLDPETRFMFQALRDISVVRLWSRVQTK